MLSITVKFRIVHYKSMSSFLNQKAFYNLIQFNLGKFKILHDETLSIKPWQIENYRQLSLQELFDKLKTLGICFDIKAFEGIALQFDTPEEMTDVLGKNLSREDTDFLYLIIFELWRRLCPEKQSLSIFCDELDHAIAKFHETGDDPYETIVKWQKILDENVDAGAPSSVAFNTIQDLCAHDLESFIYHYSLLQIELNQDLIACELIEGFYRYVSIKLWFDYLSVRCDILKESEEGYQKLENIVSKAVGAKNIDLLLEILGFVASCGAFYIFTTVLLKILPLVETEADFQEILSLSASLLSFLRDEIEEILLRRQDNQLDAPLQKDDPDFELFNQMILRGLKLR